MNPCSFLHVDIDSPATLLRFWKLPESEASNVGLFYKTAMRRALDLFADCHASATFFCVGSELRLYPDAAEMVLKAHQTGHEIANHSYSHPFSFSELSPQKVEFEIEKGSEAIHAVVGRKPVGFRAPGYGMSPAVMKSLAKQGYKYDCSVFSSSLNALLALYYKILSKRADAGRCFDLGYVRLPKLPYYSTAEDCRRPGGASDAPLEIPMPNSALFGLPFYNNFHLSTGPLYRRLDFAMMRRLVLPYLFHLIEFCDLSDGIPPSLRVHPNLRIPAAKKIKQMRNSILFIQKRYTIVRTDKFVEQYKKKTPTS